MARAERPAYPAFGAGDHGAALEPNQGGADAYCEQRFDHGATAPEVEREGPARRPQQRATAWCHHVGGDMRDIADSERPDEPGRAPIAHSGQHCANPDDAVRDASVADDRGQGQGDKRHQPTERRARMIDIGQQRANAGQAERGDIAGRAAGNHCVDRRPARHPDENVAARHHDRGAAPFALAIAARAILSWYSARLIGVWE